MLPEEWLRYVFMTVLALGQYYLFIRYVDRRSWTGESGLIINSTWIKECTAGVIIAGLVMGLVFLVEWISGDLKVTGFAWQQPSGRYWVLALLSFTVMMIGVSIVEEIMARGYLLKNLAEGFSFGSLTVRQGTVIAVILSSVIFGIMHAANPNVTSFAIINIVLAGIMLAVPFVLTGRLALSIGIHFSWNFFQGGVFGFPVSGREFTASIIQVNQQGTAFWTGSSFGPEGGLIGFIAILLVLLLTVIWLRQREEELHMDSGFLTPYSEKQNTVK